jgi:ABC-2 type transport system ATP-binding protein
VGSVNTTANSLAVEARGLVKHFGATTAVDRLSFRVEPGRVTGFLGPNGAGKTTTLRMILGLDTPNAGQALVGDRPYRDLRWPVRLAGAPRPARPGPPSGTGAGPPQAC